jgi:hypothetical protein
MKALENSVLDELQQLEGELATIVPRFLSAEGQRRVSEIKEEIVRLRARAGAITDATRA